MNRSVIVLASAACVVPALVIAAEPQSANQSTSATTTAAQPAATSSTQSTPPDKLPNNTNTDGSLKVVVHTDRTADNAADRRSDMGAVHVSFPPTEAGSRAQAELVASSARTPGVIDVPANTLGPGTPMWLIREREDAERKIAQAEAEVAKAVAERTDAASAYYQGYSLFSPGYGYGAWSRGAWGGLRGPITTTTVYSDNLGSSAQRAYHEASYPRLNGSQDAHDRAVQQYNRDATPPINRIQNEIDEAHRRANTEHPTK